MRFLLEVNEVVAKKKLLQQNLTLVLMQEGIKAKTSLQSASFQMLNQK